MAKKLSPEAVKSVLDEVGDTLDRHNVSHPVQVRFGDAEAGQHWCRETRTDENGNPTQVWVPC
jgi:hypothetical protein